MQFKEGDRVLYVGPDPDEQALADSAPINTGTVRGVIEKPMMYREPDYLLVIEFDDGMEEMIPPGSFRPLED